MHVDPGVIIYVYYVNSLSVMGTCICNAVEKKIIPIDFFVKVFLFFFVSCRKMLCRE